MSILSIACLLCLLPLVLGIPQPVPNLVSGLRLRGCGEFDVDSEIYRAQWQTRRSSDLIDSYNHKHNDKAGYSGRLDSIPFETDSRNPWKSESALKASK